MCLFGDVPIRSVGNAGVAAHPQDVALEGLPGLRPVVEIQAVELGTAQPEGELSFWSLAAADDADGALTALEGLEGDSSDNYRIGADTKVRRIN